MWDSLCFKLLQKMMFWNYVVSEPFLKLGPITSVVQSVNFSQDLLVYENGLSSVHITSRKFGISLKYKGSAVKQEIVLKLCAAIPSSSVLFVNGLEKDPSAFSYGLWAPLWVCRAIGRRSTLYSVKGVRFVKLASWPWRNKDDSKRIMATIFPVQYKT